MACLPESGEPLEMETFEEHNFARLRMSTGCFSFLLVSKLDNKARKLATIEMPLHQVCLPYGTLLVFYQASAAKSDPLQRI